MKDFVYNNIFNKQAKSFILLIDPEFHTPGSAGEIASNASMLGVDLILLGGSLTSTPLDDLILSIKSNSSCPVFLFPGNLMQMSAKADGVFLNSLISGRNPEYLIGNHVLAAHFLKKSGMEIIPTGYILVGDNSYTSVEYISNTRPIPSNKPDLIVATALAGEQLGMKLIYLEAGSGAKTAVTGTTVELLRSEISIPVIAGGGIRTADDVRRLYDAGAHAVVVGNAVERDPRILASLVNVKNESSFIR